MECRSDCPEICSLNTRKSDLFNDLEKMKETLESLETAASQNRATGEVIAKLPGGRTRQLAQKELDGAVRSLEEAQAAVDSSIEQIYNAIDANQLYEGALLNSCVEGGPVQVPDPENPGQIALICSSFTEE